MTYSPFIGRIGALAVVLGVGTAVAVPAVALAEPSDSGSSAADSSQPANDVAEASSMGDPSGSAPNNDSAAANGSDDSPNSPSVSRDSKTVTVRSSDEHTTTAADESDIDSAAVIGEPLEGSPSSGAASDPKDPSMQAQTADSTPEMADVVDERSDAMSPESEGGTEAEAEGASRRGERARSFTVDTVASVDGERSVARDVPSAGAEHRLAGMRPSRAPDTANLAAVSAVKGIATPTSAARTAATTSVVGGSTKAMAAAPDLVDTAANVVSNLVAAVFAPLFSSGPMSPADGSILWVVLGWVRREIEHVLINSSPQVRDQRVPVQLDDPTQVTAPIPIAAFDADGDTLSYAVPERGQPGGPAHGTVTIDQTTGNLVYDPDDAFAHQGGTDTFKVTVSDEADGWHVHGLLGLLGLGGSHAKTVTITMVVAPVNRQPRAGADTATTTEDTPARLAVLGNDTDADGDSLTPVVVHGPVSGTVRVNDDGTITYTPNTDFHGTDTFTYAANDGVVDSAPARVTITVSPVNDPTVAVDDTATTDEEIAATIDVLRNDTDTDYPDATPPAAEFAITTSSPAHGSAVVDAASGVIVYTPDTNFHGTDQFTYTLDDNDPATADPTATVNVVVASVNDAPVAADDTLDATEDTPARFNLADLLSNDHDPDADDVVNLIEFAQASNGTVGYDALTGILTYTPDTNFAGTDHFTYTIADRDGARSTATVNVVVAAVNDAPVIGSVQSTPTTDNSWIVTVVSTDPDLETLTTTVVSADSSIPLTVTSLTGGRFRVTASPSWTLVNPGAQVRVTVTVTDGSGGSASTTQAIGTANNLIGLGVPIPALPAGVTYSYTAAALGSQGGVLVRSDGTAVGLRTTVPALPAGVTYTQVAADVYHAVYVRSDGQAVTSVIVDLGGGDYGQLAVPTLPPGVTYTQADVGIVHTVFVRSDGQAVAVGNGDGGMTAIPTLPSGVRYIQAAAGWHNTVLLRSDGTVVAVGFNSFGQNSIPVLPSGVSYTQVAAGSFHTVLLRSNGTVVAVGSNSDGQINIPPLPSGVTYTQVAAGDNHTVLLRSDGVVVAVGNNDSGQLNIPPLPSGYRYTRVAAGGNSTILFSERTPV